MEFIKELKGGSLSSTSVVSDGNRKFVRKSISRKLNREYGLVRWQSQIRKLQSLNKYLPESSVSIELMGVNDDSYFYDVPYYEHSMNCVEALLAGEPVDLMVEKTSDLLLRMAAIGYGTSRGALAVYLSEEVRAPLDIAFELSSQAHLPLKGHERMLFKESVSRAITIVDNLLQRVENIEIRESLTHGNLTLENMLWDPRTKSILLIDPYAETYCETIIGDVSQLLQSAKSGYEIISEVFERQDYPIDKYPVEEIPTCLTNFSDRKSVV